MKTPAPATAKMPENLKTSPGLDSYAKRKGKSSSNHANCEQAVYNHSNQHKNSNIFSNKSKSSNTSSKANSGNQHNPVLFNRGSINDFFYNKNIFDIFNKENNLGN